MLDNLTALLAVPHPGICEKLGRSIGPEHFRTLVKATKCEHRLAPGEVGTVLVLVASKSQASTVFGYCLGFIESSLALRRGAWPKEVAEPSFFRQSAGPVLNTGKYD